MFEHIWTTPGQVPIAWVERVQTSLNLTSHQEWQSLNHETSKIPLLPLFNEFQMKYGFAWTAKTSLGHL